MNKCTFRSVPIKPLRSLFLFHQENQDQLLHRVSGVRRPAGLGAGDAVRCHRTGPPALDLRRDLLPGPDVSGRPADHRVHTAPVLHRLGQVRHCVTMLTQCNSQEVLER